MDNNRKKLLWSVILVILYFLLVFYIGGFNVKDKTEVIINIITIVLSVIGIVYECVLIFNKKIDLNKHKNGVLACSIYFLLVNIISGVMGFSVTKELNGNKKERRELPKIELKEYTNKYICLIAFIICLGILLFGLFFCFQNCLFFRKSSLQKNAPTHILQLRQYLASFLFQPSI